MCGILGWLGSAPVNNPVAWNRARTDLDHRGPDDAGGLLLNREGIYSSAMEKQHIARAFAGLLHTRLSIIDLSDGAAQPMVSADGRYAIAFNGEIYNYRELREELEALGHQFRTRSDTEVLLQGFVQWGTDVLQRLVGMYAFVITDRTSMRATMVRDPFGIKPCYYTLGRKGLVFASEIDALLSLGHHKARMNPRRVYDYLVLWLTDFGDETLFDGVYQLPAAHFLTVDLQTGAASVPQRYWEASIAPAMDVSFEEAAQGLRERILHSIELHLRSDVPLGACLSGGLDSSVICGAIRYLYPDADLHSFTYVASKPELSEERWADIAGRACGAVMHKVMPTADDLVQDLDDLIRNQGEPFGSSSIYAQHRVFRLAHERGIKVVLDGQGADELFGGYKLHQGASMASLLQRGQWLRVWRFYQNARHRFTHGTRDLLLATGAIMAPCLESWARRIFGLGFHPDWLDINWFESQGIQSGLPYRRSGGPEYLRRALKQAMEVTSVPQLLRYEDRNSMAFSIESRVPFLTRGLAEYVYALPDHYIISEGGESKSILRAAMRGIVPDEILDRRDKVGFATPEQDWLTQMKPWVENVLSSANDMPMLKMSGIKHEWARIQAGRQRFDTRTWRWINFIRWAEIYNVDCAG